VFSNCRFDPELVTGRFRAVQPGDDFRQPRGVLEFPSEIDYATWEAKVARVLADEAMLQDFYQGKQPGLPVKVAILPKGAVELAFGLARLFVGGNNPIETLRGLGFRVEVEHKRYYNTPDADEPVLYSPEQARYNVPVAGSLIFKRPGGKVHVEQLGWRSIADLPDPEPEANGGETRVKLFAPCGLWAEGVARCLPDVWRNNEWQPGDAFNKTVGRDLALKRAVGQANEITIIVGSSNAGQKVRLLAVLRSFSNLELAIVRAF
jgi:hypothetical protein